MDRSAGRPLGVDCVEERVWGPLRSTCRGSGPGSTLQTAVAGSPDERVAALSLRAGYSTKEFVFFLPKIIGRK